MAESFHPAAGRVLLGEADDEVAAACADHGVMGLEDRARAACWGGTSWKRRANDSNDPRVRRMSEMTLRFA